MGFVSQYTVPYVIVVGHLHVIKENYVFQFGGIPYNGILTDDGIASDKGAVSDFRILVHNQRTVEACGRRHFGTFGNPDVVAFLFIHFRVQSIAQLYNIGTYLG